MADTRGGIGDFIAAFVAITAVTLIVWGVIDIWQWSTPPSGFNPPFNEWVRSDVPIGLVGVIAGVVILVVWFVIILWQNRKRWELFE